MNCIVIAKLVGILLNEPQISTESSSVNFYKLDCEDSAPNVILVNSEFKEVNVISINKDLSYNIEIKMIN